MATRKPISDKKKLSFKDKRAIDPNAKKYTGRPKEADPAIAAQEMMDWVQKDDALNICGFCADYNYSDDMIYDWAKTSPIFSEAWKRVRFKLADKREKKVSEGKLHQLAYAKNHGVYDRFTHRHDEKNKDRESDRRKAETSTPVNANALLDLSKLVEENDQLKKQVAELLAKLGA
jgi:hypothetical protein